MPLLPIRGLGYWHMFITCILLPWIAWRCGQRAKNAPLPPRSSYYVSALVTAGFLGAMALWVAHEEEMVLFPAVVPSLVVLVLGISRYWEYVARSRDRRMQFYCEPTALGSSAWVAVSLSAGPWDEIVHRGALPVLIALWLGSTPLAIAAVAFGLAQTQRLLVARLIMLIGFLLHALVYFRGTRYVAIAAHFPYDVTAGFSYMRLAKNDGITRERAPAPTR